MFLIGSYVRRGIHSIIDYSIPQSEVGVVIATGFAWYGKQVAITYAPGVLANMCIQATVESVGSVSAGTFIGTTVVAPAMVPRLIDTAVWVTAAVFGCVAAVIYNLFHQLIRAINGYRGSNSANNQSLKIVANSQKTC